MSNGEDFGMKEVQCPDCAGLGQVITPHAIPREDGSIDIWETADICFTCGGDRTVWM